MAALENRVSDEQLTLDNRKIQNLMYKLDQNDSNEESSIEKLADAFFEPKNDETKDD